MPSLRSALRPLLGLTALGVTAASALGALALSIEFRPPARQNIQPECKATGKRLSASDPFTVVSWNLQYSAGRAQHFFYDGGKSVSVPPAEVSETLAGITAALRTIEPDIALLQEIDRNSARTGRVDQLPPLRSAMGAACQLSTPYHRARFVPHPTMQPLGRVDMHLALLTPAGLQQGERRALPLLRESRLRQAFNLKRAILWSELAIDGSKTPLAIAVTHLSAFSGDGATLSEQMGILKRWMDERPVGQPWILGADLNAVPPGDDPARVGEHDDAYRGAQPALAELMQAHSSVFSEPLAAEARTYMPFGAHEPDRKIDYLFYGGPLTLLNARVGHEFTHLSDHLPIIASFAIDPLEVP